LAWTGRAPDRDGVSWQRHVDRVCAVGAAAAFAALLISTAETAILLTIVTDLVAAIPTVTVAWRQPHTQPVWMFFGIAVYTGLSTLAGQTPDRLIEVAYLLYVFGLGTAMVTVIFIREAWLDGRPIPALPSATYRNRSRPRRQYSQPDVTHRNSASTEPMTKEASHATRPNTTSNTHTDLR
jgi:hypothetical protein